MEQSDDRDQDKLNTTFSPPQIVLDLCFDPDSLVIEGWYSSQMAAYRARKVWRSTLESNFLLDRELDFAIHVDNLPSHGLYGVICSFTSACGRYAFWRLTNQQAPEVQGIIETAHLPGSDQTAGNSMDLRGKHSLQKNPEPLSWNPESAELQLHDTWLQNMKEIIGDIVTRLSPGARNKEKLR
jgi:hypothetical protein